MGYQKTKYYAPAFTEHSAVSVRRFAWALGASMGQAVDVLVSCLPGFIKTEKVCASCKDNTKCHACAFREGAELPEVLTAFLYQ